MINEILAADKEWYHKQRHTASGSLGNCEMSMGTQAVWRWFATRCGRSGAEAKKSSCRSHIRWGRLRSTSVLPMEVTKVALFLMMLPYSNAI
ncbi:MAG: hypothetical protein KDA90_18930 [Planctomycetaceae bacterium]|nr:hypothetical protein [Planctomycetaceae bacterium]